MVRSGMASAIAIAIEKPFGGGRHSMGDATQLHHSIVATELPVRISLTMNQLREQDLEDRASP